MSTTPQLRLRGLQPGGSNDRNSLCHNGLDDSSPVPDVEGCYEISFSLKTTGNAFESGSFRPVLPDKVALSPYPFEWNFTVFSHGYRYSDPSPGGIDADFIHSFETEYSLVMDYASEISEPVENRSIQFICLNDLCYHSDSEL